MSTASSLVFLTNRAEVLSVSSAVHCDAQTRLIAVTAEASESLETCGLPHDAVAQYSDTRVLSRLDDQINLQTYAMAGEIERYVGDEYPQSRFDGPGFLTSQGYWIQYAASAILTRAFVIRETIAACSPRRVIFFGGQGSEFENTILGANSLHRCWLTPITTWATDNGLECEILPVEGAPSQYGWARHSREFLRRVLRRVFQEVRRLSSDCLGNRAASHAHQVRILIGENPDLDWVPVLNELRRAGEVDCAAMTGRYLDHRVWTFYYRPQLQKFSSRSVSLNPAVDPPHVSSEEARSLSILFDTWKQKRAARLSYLDVDIFPGLAPILKSMTVIGPTLVRHADKSATEVLGTFGPDLICFLSMPGLAKHRLAYHARRTGVPVVSYQHGGCYGTHILPKNEQIEPAQADVFLTYGSGIRPREHAAFPPRATYVPVGSSRVAAMVERQKRRVRNGDRAVHVLWVAELSTQNLWGGVYQVEDTKRYRLQKRCLEILNARRGVCVTYRPYPHQVDWDGTARWIWRKRPRGVRVDICHQLEDLIQESDVVITDATSNTTWNEAIAMRRPLICYLDPTQTPLSPHFAADLDRACHWCQAEESLIDACHRLAAEGKHFLADINRRDPADYLCRYVLHRPNSDPVSEAIVVLRRLIRNTGSHV
jgi:hypothetical protein